MDNHSMLGIIDEYFKINPPPYFSFDFGKLIPLRKLKNAKKLYAQYDEEKEQPLLLIDDTFFRSGKKGILITNLHLFYRLYSKRGNTEIKKAQFSLNEITSLYIDIGRMGSNLIINKNKEAFTIAFGVDEPKKTEAEILNKLFEMLINPSI